MQRYVYSLIRYVPSPSAGEFVNIAAIAGSDETGEWSIRQIENDIRARQLGQSPTLAAVYSFTTRLGLEIDQTSWASEYPEFHGDVSERWLEDMATLHNNIVQLTKPTPMLADTVEDALDLVFERMIIDPARKERARGYRSRTTARSAVRNAYTHYGVPSTALREQLTLTVDGLRSPIDFAIHNGHALQLAQAWSFRVTDQRQIAQEAKAWSFAIAALRRGDGIIYSAETAPLTVARDIDVEVVYVPPAEQSASLEEALKAFEQVDAHATEFTGANDVAAKAAVLLEDAGVELAYRL